MGTVGVSLLSRSEPSQLFGQRPSKNIRSSAHTPRPPQTTQPHRLLELTFTEYTRPPGSDTRRCLPYDSADAQDCWHVPRYWPRRKTQRRPATSASSVRHEAEAAQGREHASALETASWNVAAESEGARMG